MPGRGLTFAAAAVALAGIGGAAALAGWALLSQEDPVRFAAPGAAAVEVAKPGAYLLWHDYRTLYGNRSYSEAPELPGGARIEVFGPAGEPVAVAPVSKQTWSGDEADRQAFGRFQAAAAGRYSVSVRGPIPDIVVSVAPDTLGRTFGAIAGALLLGFLGVGGGIGIAVYALGRQAKPNAEPGQRPPPRAGHAVTAAAAEPMKRLQEMAMIIYVLQAAAPINGVTLIGAVVLGYLNRDAVAGTWLESHLRWQIRTFWWTLLWAGIGFATAIVLVGIPVLLATLVWFIYRVARGWSALNAGRPVP